MSKYLKAARENWDQDNLALTVDCLLLHLESAPREEVPPHRHHIDLIRGRSWTTGPEAIPEPREETLQTPQSGSTLPESANVNLGETTRPSREQEIAEETRSISVAINSLLRLGVPSAELECHILPALMNKIYGPIASTRPAGPTTGRSASIDDLQDAVDSALNVLAPPCGESGARYAYNILLPFASEPQPGRALPAREEQE